MVFTIFQLWGAMRFMLTQKLLMSLFEGDDFMSLKTDYSQAVIIKFTIARTASYTANTVLKTRLNFITDSGTHYLNNSGDIVSSSSYTWSVANSRIDSTDIDINDYVEGYLLWMAQNTYTESKLAIEFKKPVLLFPYLNSITTNTFGEIYGSPANNTLYIAEYDDISVPAVSPANAGYISYKIPLFVNKGTRMSLTGPNYNATSGGYGNNLLGLTFVPYA